MPSEISKAEAWLFWEQGVFEGCRRERLACKVTPEEWQRDGALARTYLEVAESRGVWEIRRAVSERTHPTKIVRG